MSRIESYTATKIDSLIDASASSLTLAISTAVAAEKSRADTAYLVNDYVVVRTTGTNTDIQAVFDIAETNGGGSITIPKGIWTINSPLLIPSNIKLYLSPGAIIRRGLSSVNNLLRNKSNGTLGGYTANQDITISGGEWDGNAASFPNTNCTLIAFGHCDNILVEEGEFYGVDQWHQVEFNAVRRGVARNNLFRDHPGDTELLQLDGAISSGAFPWFGPFDNTFCDDTLVQGNTFRNAFRGFGSHASFAGRWHKNTRIVDNHFASISKWGLELQDYRSVVIDNNTFDDCGIGIYAFSVANQLCTSFVVSNNVFTNSGTRAAYFDGGTEAGRYIRLVTYTGNIVYVSGQYGLTADFCQGVTYTGNHITTCQSMGIWVYRDIEVTVTGNRLVGNNLGGDPLNADLKVGDAGQLGITSTQDITITGNTIGTCYVRAGKNILINSNIILDSYTASGSAPAPTTVARIANIINGVYQAT